jgi:hypothetical protein
MAVREFLAVESGWQATGSFETVMNGPHTLLALVKPLTFNEAGQPWLTLRSGTAQLASITDGGSGKLAYFTSTEDARSNVGETADAWQLLAWTKASEAARPRAHRKVLGSGGWTHLDATGDVISYKTEALADIRIANFSHVRVATVAIFDTALSDVDLEAIDAVATTQLLADLGAIHLWEFNQASPATAVQDLAGTAHQTAISAGSTAVTGDDPAGWTFGVVVIPPLDFSVRLSGGAANADPVISIGGAESSESPGSDLFDDVSNAERTGGLIDYRLIYIHNNDTASGSVIAYVPTQLEAGRQLAVGVATQLAGATVPAIATDQTAPAGVAFSAPTTAPAGVSLDTIPAGSFRGLWLRRTVNSGTAQDPTNIATIKLEVSRVE